MQYRTAQLVITFPPGADDSDRRRVESALTDLAQQVGYPATLMIDSLETLVEASQVPATPAEPPKS